MYGAFIFWPKLTVASNSDSVNCKANLDAYGPAMPCVDDSCATLAVCGIVITILDPVAAWLTSQCVQKKGSNLTVTQATTANSVGNTAVTTV